MKTKEELNALKEEIEMLNKKLAELTEEELKTVTGGSSASPEPPEPPKPQRSPSSRKMKKNYCTNCGYVKDILTESSTSGGSSDEQCPQCGAKKSFKIVDIE